MRRGLKRPVTAVGLDVLAVIVFVTIGRRSHHEAGNIVVGELKVAAPLLIALAVGWLIGRAWRAPLSAAMGIGVWICTVVIGLALRRLVFGRGIAFAFVVVTTVTLAVLMLGWRLAADQLARHQRQLPGKDSEPARQ